ncbi:MAG: hypothetical protein KIT11_07705 [Fimbriimonadaceae bacterium]|nr:hypothetical protein [Fimbriimonadaceae bacterium]QYK56238.1 MAG: hypothetical protein KF733_01895 [Fimbriimonadaceae bacterium]
MKETSEKTVLAVDPGSSKCGLALVRRAKNGKIELLWRAIAPVENLCRHAKEAAEVSPYSMIVVGSGTRSRNIVENLRDELPAVGILIVDERDTTLKARERYWEHNPRRGWRKIVPATLQSPPEPVDDFVALILAERVLSAD